MTDPAGDQSTGELDSEWALAATLAAEGFFQGPAQFAAER
jgi:hypothetical protein